jgi:hypothetical protein
MNKKKEIKIIKKQPATEAAGCYWRRIELLSVM